jgi:hypothetical protein
VIWFVVGLVIGVCLAAIVAAARRFRRRDDADGPAKLSTPANPLDLRPRDGPDAGNEALELWWDANPIMSIERLDDRQLPASKPVPGALATLLSDLLDDQRIRHLVEGDRYALIKVPRSMRGHDWVRAMDGRTLPLLRDPDNGRFARIPTLAGGAGAGAGVGAAATTAPVVAAAVAAAWAHQQLESTMTAMRAGMERVALRLDDTDHGVIAAAQSQLARLTGHPSTWSAMDLAEMAAHRTALERVYHTAQRRADRRFDAMMAGDQIPELDAGEVEETQRDLMLLVDATLARGQMDFVRAITMLDGTVEGLAELGRVEDELRDELAALATRLDGALERTEPGWHRVGARRKVLQLKSELGRTLGGLEELLSELNTDDDAELLVGERDGRLEIRSMEPTTLGPVGDEETGRAG